MNIAINDISRSIAAWEEFGSLTGLSIQYTRPGATPTAPSNAGPWPRSRWGT